MRRMTVTKVLALVLVVFVLGIAIGSTAQYVVGPTAARILSSLGFPVDPQVAKLLSVRNIVLAQHVDTELDVNELMEQAIRGLLSKVDGGYTRYESIEEGLKRREADTGEYAGIGVTVRMVEDQVNIESVFRGSPAQNAGLLPRDIIIGVEGESIRGMVLTDVTDIIKGPPGTPVELTIFRPSSSTTFQVIITRDRIVIPVVEYKIVNPRLAHVILTQFTPTATDQMQNVLLDLQQQGIGHILLDLRFNPGGYTNIVESIADFFLPPDLVIYKGVSRDESFVEYKTSRAPIYTGDVSLLINQGSASASEILTGALRDHLKSTVLGVKSFGKGTVQYGYPLGDGSRVWVTTQTYRTPSGIDINKKGIEPDVVIEMPLNAPAGTDIQLEEAIDYVLKNLIR